ncbi:MAG: septal ring lytic transglycosylase RlpA family protein [Thermoanaerobaculaceae bacterium]|nr:septal ring lytic transglycosylase RlpA family protein [Thermoanaerobaculaceae bacterium]MDI9622402.1 septal ring lytic transglycosylase RlpA family protein [Acidobacteriota bacterium]NLH11157.1 septal ring lytic transglycosylase RlpA family protein [Holophagae bacterium]HPW54303.1 septal ring lytic transglycosylase RlpA family protein [Thermoanaerobaculaceae bacterium]
MLRRSERRQLVPTAGWVAVALLAACTSIRPPAAGSDEEGLASWYGEPYHGRPTASGRIFDQRELTAAHRTLPFGTRVVVTRLDNGRAVEVVVNDRGPFVAGRIIDLSRAAAAELQLIGVGVARVRVSVLVLGDGMLDAPCWEVQVGAFARPENLRRARETLVNLGYRVRLLPASGGLTRVRVEALRGRQEAEATARRLAADYPGAVAVPCLPDASN